jgi:hypothetical protein
MYWINVAGKPKGRQALTPTERQRRRRAKKKKLETGAAKRAKRQTNLTAVGLRNERARRVSHDTCVVDGTLTSAHVVAAAAT